MPDFRSSAAGLHHFAVVKNLFHLVQLVGLVTLPSFYFFVNRIVKKGFLSLFSKGLLGSSSLAFTDWTWGSFDWF